MKKVIVLLAFLLVAIPCKAETFIVDPNGSADFNNIQDAINYSWDGDIIVVRLGTYYENINFYGKEIIVTSTDPNNSDVVSGTIIWGNNPAGTVRFETYEDSDSVLAGFTIQSTDTSGHEQGTGVYCYYSSPLISKNVIKNHYYGVWGESASPTLVENQVSSNVSTGIWDCDGQITMCAVSGNGSDGLKYCDGEVENCDIYENGQDGIAVCNITINNCVIRNNNNHGLGSVGGEIINCTIVNNGQSGLGGCAGIIKNCIITFNNHYGIEGGSGSFEYNNIWNNGYGSYGGGAIPSLSDIHTEPLFADVVNHDYHLKSEIGRWSQSSQTWVIDSVSSPSIDAGNPCDSTGSETYPNGDRINQGVYGGTTEASKSPSGQYTYCTEPIAGDLDDNCKVDFNDFALLANDWFTTEELEQSDSNVIQEWVARHNGPDNGDDTPYAMVIDSLDNVYVTGVSRKGEGPGDYVTIKYEPNGNEIWVATYNGPDNGTDGATAIAIDSSNYVYVTGGSDGSGTMLDYTTIKYGPDSNEPIWIARYDGPDNRQDYAQAIAIDNNDNIYVTGHSKDSGTGYDYVTIKYAPDSNVPLWVARYNSPSNNYDFATAIAIDSNDNIYVTGESEDSSSFHLDYATIKYAPDSNVPLWVARYNSPSNNSDWAYAIAIDSNDNVYVTGTSEGSGMGHPFYDYVTIKYPPESNVPLWVARYDGPDNYDDRAYAIAIDSNNNIYVTGNSTNSGTSDYATVKYAPDSNVPLWVARYNGPDNDGDYAQAIAIDNNDNIYVTGYSKDSETVFDYATIKYAPDSNVPLWIARYNGLGNHWDEATAIAIDSDDNVYVTGYSPGTDTGNDYATVKYSPGLICTIEIAGDFNNDCIVDFLDLKTITDHWLDCNLDPPEACWE